MNGDFVISRNQTAFFQKDSYGNSEGHWGPIQTAELMTEDDAGYIHAELDAYYAGRDTATHKVQSIQDIECAELT